MDLPDLSARYASHTLNDPPPHSYGPDEYEDYPSPMNGPPDHRRYASEGNWVYGSPPEHPDMVCVFQRRTISVYPGAAYTVIAPPCTDTGCPSPSPSPPLGDESFGAPHPRKNPISLYSTQSCVAKATKLTLASVSAAPLPGPHCADSA